MIKNIDRTWVRFYKELAERLLDYKSNRENLIAKIKKVYELTEMKLPTLERNNQMTDVDPFTVFGLFNKSSMKESNKIKVLEKFAELFDIKAKVPSSFDSIPTINNLNATYYYFEGDREKDDIDNLWLLFEVALAYAKDKTKAYKYQFIKFFNLVMAQKGIGTSKLTSGLYWIAPEFYVNLDSRSRWYIFETEKVPYEYISQNTKLKDKISAEEYLEIIHKLKIYLTSTKASMKDFVDFSYETWRYSEEINKKNKGEVETTNADEDVEIVNYWTFSPESEAANWESFYQNGIISIGWNELDNFSIYEDKHQIKEKLQEINKTKNRYHNIANAVWQFTKEMKIGDIVYAKKDQSKIIGWGEISSDHIYNPNEEFKNIRYVEWKEKGEWITPVKLTNKTLTKITPYNELVEKLNELFDSNGMDTIEETLLPYDTSVYKKIYKKELLKKIIISIQHGMIIHNISPYLSKSQYSIDYITANSQYEKDIIVETLGYNNDDVLITGMSRHDNLLDKSVATQYTKEVLFMPTWQRGLQNLTVSQFLESNFYKKIYSLLNNERLIQFLKREQLHLNVLMHPQFEKYVQYLKSNKEEITFLSMSDVEIPNMIAKSKFLITDFSSVAVDFLFRRL